MRMTHVWWLQMSLINQVSKITAGFTGIIYNESIHANLCMGIYFLFVFHWDLLQDVMCLNPNDVTVVMVSLRKVSVETMQCRCLKVLHIFQGQAWYNYVIFWNVVRPVSNQGVQNLFGTDQSWVLKLSALVFSHYALQKLNWPISNIFCWLFGVPLTP